MLGPEEFLFFLLGQVFRNSESDGQVFRRLLTASCSRYITRTTGEVHSMQEASGAFVVAICGPSCSGKTTLSRLLTSTFSSCTVISQDDFYYVRISFGRLTEFFLAIRSASSSLL